MLRRITLFSTLIIILFFSSSVIFETSVCVGYNTNLKPYAYDFDIAVQYTDDAGFACLCTTPETTQTGNRTVFIAILFSLISISILNLIKNKKKGSEKT